MKKEMKGEEIVKIGEENKKIEQELLKSMKVPEDTLKYDIFVRNIKVRNNQVINAIRTSYSNYSLYVFKKDEAIYFCDTYELIKLKVKEKRLKSTIKNSKRSSMKKLRERRN